MNSFIRRPARVIFGQGSVQQLEAEVLALGAQRALVLCAPEQHLLTERVAQGLGARAAGIFNGAVMHVPIETAQCAR